MKRLQERDGIPASEQIRRALRPWLEQKGVLKAERKRAETRKRFGGATGGRFTRFMGKNGFLASLIVRLVPSAPFVVVNMAFGAARVGFLAFIGGLALGVLPKTAILAFGMDAIFDALEGKVGSAVAMGVAAIALWIIVAVIVRNWLRPPSGT